jgi:hypothetical protein
MAAKTLDIPAINELTVSKKRETGIKLGDCSCLGWLSYRLKDGAMLL